MLTRFQEKATKELVSRPFCPLTGKNNRYYRGIVLYLLYCFVLRVLYRIVLVLYRVPAYISSACTRGERSWVPSAFLKHKSQYNNRNSATKNLKTKKYYTVILITWLY